MFNKKKVNLKQINKVMKNKMKQEKEVKERNVNRFIKKVKSTFSTSPMSVDRFKKPQRELRILD
jgi:hypothetical protein